jgi:hypothetical protein
MRISSLPAGFKHAFAACEACYEVARRTITLNPAVFGTSVVLFDQGLLTAAARQFSTRSLVDRSSVLLLPLTSAERNGAASVLQHHWVQQVGASFSSSAAPRREGAITYESLQHQQAYQSVLDYLVETLPAPKATVERILEGITTTGFRGDGQMFRLASRRPISLEHQVKPVIAYLRSIPGIRLRQVVTNARYILVCQPEELARFQSNAEQLTSLLKLQQGELAKIINTAGECLKQVGCTYGHFVWQGRIVVVERLGI